MFSSSDFAAKTSKYVLYLLWAHVPLLAAISFAFGRDGWIVPAIVAVLCAGAQLAYRLDPRGVQTAMVSSAALAITIAMVVFEFRGHPWQTDTHMYFFAGLAITALFLRWQAVLVFATVVALHHLSLNYAMTEAVFPGEADLGRVLLHAVILIIEAVPLLFLTFALEGMFSRLGTSLSLAETARAQAEVLTQDSVQRQATLNSVVTYLGDGLQRLSHGDLQHRITGPNAEVFAGDLAALRENYNQLADRLTKTFSAVSESASLVYAASNETASAALDIARKAEHQANTVNQSSENLSQLNVLFGQTADLAKDANGQIQHNRLEVERSGKVLDEAVRAMGKIEDSARLIRQSVDAIDDIAFQTNLLALNAGVEAARAGDSASGFAVVAQEVRNLAQRASGSAAEIRRLILDSDVHVGQGATVVAATATNLRNLIDGTVKAADIVQTITTRAEGQARNLSELTSGVAALEMTAQQFAGAAEETTATSSTLREQANYLTQVIAAFTDGPKPTSQGAAFGSAGSSEFASTFGGASHYGDDDPVRVAS